MIDITWFKYNDYIGSIYTLVSVTLFLIILVTCLFMIFWIVILIDGGWFLYFVNGKHVVCVRGWARYEPQQLVFPSNVDRPSGFWPNVYWHMGMASKMMPPEIHRNTKQLEFLGSGIPSLRSLSHRHIGKFGFSSSRYMWCRSKTSLVSSEHQKNRGTKSGWWFGTFFICP